VLVDVVGVWSCALFNGQDFNARLAHHHRHTKTGANLSAVVLRTDNASP
jgi:hypothetical protein